MMPLDPAPTGAPSTKAELRGAAEDLRRRLHRAHGARAASAVAQAALPFLADAAPRTISGYLAIGSELDPVALMERLRGEGHLIALPVVAGRGKPLTFRAWSPGDPLAPGWRGLREPLASAGAVEPDLLLVPLLAVDRAGYRLGYGAGYYDLTLAGLRRRRAVTAVGVGFAGQVVEALPREAHDQPVDWILTEDGAVRAEQPLAGPQT